MTKVSVIWLFLGISLLYSQRKELNNWDFYLDQAPDAVTKVILPHTWNGADAFDDEPGYFRGVGTYTTSFQISDISKKYYLHFDGANQTTTVFVNDQVVETHTGGYTAFDFEITSFVKYGNNRVVVKVDNSHVEATPPLDADFTFYGGLYRKVYLEQENKQHFARQSGADAVLIVPTYDEDANGSILIKGSIEGVSNADKGLKLKITLLDKHGKILSQKDHALPVENGVIDFEHILTVSKPELWSPEAPNLYEVRAEILNASREVLDSYNHQVGFRTVKATAEGFFINGKPLKLIGVNRHQDLQGFGNAVPTNLQIGDLKAIKEMGSNFLRLAHYPQDKAIYRAADSLGLILWSEIPVVNKVPADDYYEAYRKHALEMQKEHILQNQNHPSLVFLGYMNEIFLRMVFDKPEETVKKSIIENTLALAKELETLTRKLAPNHITVMALHGDQIYNETGISDIPMVIGWNLYYGWYVGKIYDLGPFLDEEHRKYPNRPLIISEYGVGADVRLHNPRPEKFDFSEEYQMDYHAGYVDQVKKRPFVIGMSAWNYADFGSEFRGDARPHVNQKGLVNFDRVPKNIYYWYKSILRPEIPVLRIYRDLPVHVSETPLKEITIITNRDIKLQVNEESLGEFHPTDGVVKVQVELTQGKNLIRTESLDGKISDVLHIDWQKPIPTHKGHVLAMNFGTQNKFIDNQNIIWIPATEILPLKDKEEQVKTSTNIRNTENDPIYQTGRSKIKSLHLNVPKGDYKITFVWARYGKNTSLIFELGEGQNESKQPSEKSATLLINEHQLAIPELEPFHKAELFLKLKTKGKGIEIIKKDNGYFSLMGLKLERLN